MLVNINLNKDFERFFDVLKEEYGDDFAELNSLSDEYLSFNDYINNFIAKDTVADASADGSSNVHNKDIVTLRSEMGKPHEKLLAYKKAGINRISIGLQTTNNEILKLIGRAHLLNEFEREVINLKINGFKYKEIADILGKDTKFIDNTIQKCKNKIREQLAKS